MGRIHVDVTVANNIDLAMFQAGSLPGSQIRQVTLTGLVDTGANHLILPESVVKTLGVPKVGEATVHYGDHSTNIRDMVDQVQVQLLGRKASFTAISEPKRTTALIGAIVLEQLDFVADCGNQRIFPRDPERIIAEVGVRELADERT